MLGLMAPLRSGSSTRVTSPTRGSFNGHEWVDLGLPSGLKWATCNMGALSPEDYGDYYAWGETSPKSEYLWGNYRFRESGDAIYNVTFSKYNTKDERGSVDNKTQLDYSDDAARVNWGGNWRMATFAEWEELKTQCDWTWTTQGGKNGYKVTSKMNGDSIFLPAAGFRDSGYPGDTDLINGGIHGYYCSSTLYTEYPYGSRGVDFGSSGVRMSAYGVRYNGESVRPVSE